MTDKFVTKVLKEGDDLVFLFPEDFIKKLNLKHDDVLEWTVMDNGTVVIKVAGSVKDILPDGNTSNEA